MKPNSDTTPKLYIGLDVDKEQTSVAIADPGSDGEIRSYGNIATTQPSIAKFLRRLAKARGLKLTDLPVCYEAGACEAPPAPLLAQGTPHVSTLLPRSGLPPTFSPRVPRKDWGPDKARANSHRPEGCHSENRQVHFAAPASLENG